MFTLAQTKSSKKTDQERKKTKKETKLDTLFENRNQMEQMKMY